MRSTPDVRKQLMVVAANPNNVAKIRDNLSTTLRKKNADLDKYSADLLIALDLRGKCHLSELARMNVRPTIPSPAFPQ